MCKNVIEDNNENKFSRFNDTVSKKKNDFRVYSLNRDHSLAYELIKQSNK